MFAYFDFHAHASKKGIFVFGNKLADETNHIESMLLAKLISMNSLNFDMSECNFGEKNMNAKDKNGLSKQGASRVTIQ